MDFQLISEVSLEAESRPVSQSMVPIIDVTDETDNILSPGTLTLILTHPDSPGAAELTASARNGHLLVERLKTLKQKFDAKEPPAPNSVMDRVKAAPVIVDVRYRTRILAMNLPILDGEDEATVVSFPYSGGDILAEGITLTAKSKNNRGVAAFAYLTRPALTPAEQAALYLLPPDQLEANIGQSGMCYALTGVAVGVGVIAATSLCRRPDGWRIDPVVDLSDNPTIAVSQLLSRRREYLAKI